MAFWDGSDKFNFEKRFSVQNFANDYQSNIWYLDNMEMWITTDHSNILSAWDIEKEVRTMCISSKKINNSIIEVTEIS